MHICHLQAAGHVPPTKGGNLVLSTSNQAAQGSPVLAQAAADRKAIERQRCEVVYRALPQLQRQPAVHHTVHGLLPDVCQVRLQAAGADYGVQS